MRKRPGKVPEEYEKYMETCNAKIKQTGDEIRFLADLAKELDKRVNKETIKRIKYAKKSKDEYDANLVVLGKDTWELLSLRDYLRRLRNRKA